MLYNVTIKSVFIITIICIISNQPIIALSEEKIIDDNKPLDWEHSEVFFFSQGYSNDISINNKSTLRTCFVKNVRLYIYYQMPVWPLFPNFKIWNSSGLITDFNVDFCSFHANNFTGLIIHRISLLGNYWYSFGHCQYFKMRTGYN
jgi:hypothetical protein